MKLEITGVLIEFNRFSRAMKWREYWHGREREEYYEMRTFKTRKYNLPKNHNTWFKNIFNSVKSKIMYHKNRNKEKCNFPQKE